MIIPLRMHLPLGLCTSFLTSWKASLSRDALFSLTSFRSCTHASFSSHPPLLILCKRAALSLCYPLFLYFPERPSHHLTTNLPFFHLNKSISLCLPTNSRLEALLSTEQCLSLFFDLFYFHYDFLPVPRLLQSLNKCLILSDK